MVFQECVFIHPVADRAFLVEFCFIFVSQSDASAELCILSVYSEPERPPHNVRTARYNTTATQVLWDKVLPLYQHGRILGYGRILV